MAGNRRVVGTCPNRSQLFLKPFDLEVGLENDPIECLKGRLNLLTQTTVA
jgi:hypothetical protein